jgi:hypothetical protein
MWATALPGLETARGGGAPRDNDDAHEQRTVDRFEDEDGTRRRCS